MNTCFATPERESPAELASEFEFVSQNPVISGLMFAVGGLLAILNEHLQVVALNDTFLHALGVQNAKDVLGLRMGEALRCVHASEPPCGCCTTPYCATCGAAIAFVSSLMQDAPAERVCALQANRSGKLQDVLLLIRAQGLKMGGRRYVLVFAQDVTQQQQWAALDRTFFHDVNNLLCQLLCASEMLAEENPSELALSICQTVQRLAKEVEVQRYLKESEEGALQASRRPVCVRQIFQELKPFFASHPAAREKRLSLPEEVGTVTVSTDAALMLRVLCNMIINAFEATPAGGEVRVWLEPEPERLTFCVWNAQAIPQDVALRIFQRNFSTKRQAGRGVGTYSMKLLGEKLLGGAVTFTSSEPEGTVFRFCLPL